MNPRRLRTVTPLFQVEVTHPAADSSAAAPAAGPLPERFHIHRQPEKRPHAFMAVAFTALVGAELILLLWTLSRHPAANLGAWPGFGSAAGLACVAFHGGIAGILGLYLLFWARLNILQTLPLLAVLGLFTTVSGNRALLALADARAKAA